MQMRNVYETFSQRQMVAARAGTEDVYKYDDISAAFRNQAIHILKDCLGWQRSADEIAWKPLHDGFARQMGYTDLSSSLRQNVSTNFGGGYGALPSLHAILPPNNVYQNICGIYIQNAMPLHVIDFIEYAIHWITDRAARSDTPFEFGDSGRHYGITMTPQEAVIELNFRFRQNGIGYQLEGGQIVRVDSQYIHAATTVPAIRLLRDATFEGAEKEFMEALEHYRNRDNKATIVSAENAFESTVKTICDQRGWAYAPTVTAGGLIELIFDNGFVPSHLDDNRMGMRSMLQGLSVLRNKSTAAHGAGAAPVDVPDHMASFALHLAASCIVFLVNQHRTMP
jgi:hypothetical protein